MSLPPSLQMSTSSPGWLLGKHGFLQKWALSCRFPVCTNHLARNAWVSFVPSTPLHRESELRMEKPNGNLHFILEACHKMWPFGRDSPNLHLGFPLGTDVSNGCLCVVPGP